MTGGGVAAWRLLKRPKQRRKKLRVRYIQRQVPPSRYIQRQVPHPGTSGGRYILLRERKK